MASPAACWRCTGRALLNSSTRSRSSSASRLPRPPSIPVSTPSSATRQFHTNPPLAAAAKGGDPRKGKVKVNKPMNLKSKRKTVYSGDRLFRRQKPESIVLSNGNAPILDLPELTAPTMSDFDSVGKVFSIKVEDLEKLRQLEVFQKKQFWQFFYRPTTFLRSESIAIARAMERVERHGSQTAAEDTTSKPEKQNEKSTNVEKEKAERDEIYAARMKAKASLLKSWADVEALKATDEEQAAMKQEIREDHIKHLKEIQENASNPYANYIITGKGGTGKSILLLQSIVLAIRRKWMVIPITNAHEVVIGTTAYEINSDSGRYVQRSYLSKLLSKISKANTELLLEAKVQDAVDIGNTHIKAGNALISIVDAGSSGPEHSYEAFVALLKELEKPGAPPVLLTMDNLEYAMRPGSGYMSPDFKEVYPHDLDIVHTFLDYLSGRRKFARQMVIASTTSELHPNPSLELAIHGKPLPGIGNYDYRIPSALGDISKTITLKGLSRAHTKLLLEFYKRAGLWDHSWDRSIPISPALEKAGISETEYRELKGHNSWDRPLEAIEEGKTEGAAQETLQEGPKNIPMSELKKTLQVEAEKKANAGLVEMQRMAAALAERPLTEHEVVERHVLTNGVPRELLKLCLRMQGSLNM